MQTKPKENRVNRFSSANHDSENSKYKHLIYFETKNIVLSGYSGKVGLKERDNDIDNFINYVLRLMKTHYYPGSTRDIEIIDFYVLADDDKIVSLRKGYAAWEPKYLFEPKWKKAQRTIEDMYDLLEKKWPLVQIDDKLRVKARAKSVFDPHDMTPRFTSDKALVKHCNELLRKGFSQGEIELYLRNYRSKYFNQ